MWLRHRTAPTTTWTEIRFQGLRMRRLPISERKSGVTLRNYIYDKKLANRISWDIAISADEVYGVSSAARTFIEAFFGADEREFNESMVVTPAPAAGWVAVQIEGGPLPVEDIEGHKHLNEYNMILNEKAPI